MQFIPGIVVCHHWGPVCRDGTDGARAAVMGRNQVGAGVPGAKALAETPLSQYQFPFGSSAFTGLQFQAGLRHLLFIYHLGILCWQERWKGCG